MLTLEFLKNHLEEYHLPYEDKAVFIQVKRLLHEEDAICYWSSIGCVFFGLKDDATFTDTRPLLFPVERVEKVQYQKKILSNDEFSFEVEGEKFQFEIPHRSKYFSNQKEQLKLFRVMMEQ